jgi:kumamolisin
MGQFVSKIQRIKYPRLDRRIVAHTAQYYAKQHGYPILSAPSDLWVDIVELGGANSMSDLSGFCQAIGIPVPQVKEIGTPQPDPGGADIEVLLDVQNVVGATGGMVNIRLIYGPNTTAGFAGAIQQSSDGLAVAGSISWGSEEASYSASDFQAMNAAFQAAASPYFSASGDNGSSDGGRGNNADFPASSPYAFGVGGTTFNDNGSESAWSSGGGGPSAVWQRPTFQTINGSMRGVPDVAEVADPNTGYAIVVNGQQQIIGGTSGAAPMWAAFIALCCAKAGKRITFAQLAPLLYQQQALFTDITTGSNGSFRAGVGYDYCTGLGVPSKALADAIIAAMNPTAPPPVNPPPIVPPGAPTVLTHGVYTVPAGTAITVP